MASSGFFKKIKSLAIVTASATAVYTGLSFYKGNEQFYEKFLMPAVHNLSPETAHDLAVFACKYNLFPASASKDPETLHTAFFGHQLSNPIGIAAGFDKQGQAIEGLQKIGFGFIEVGSVTPWQQSGNPKPRVFRSSSDQAIINRYGFNSLGHDAVYVNVQNIKSRNNFTGVLGINLGKNMSSENPFEDYSKGVEMFSPLADYLVVNISSPNTPGLRLLQNKKELEGLLSKLLQVRASLPKDQQKPILLKLAPDLTKDDMKDIASVVRSKKCKIDGLIIANTTIDRSDLKNHDFALEHGGLSGAPLKDRSTNLIAEMYALTKGEIPIIGVGGIFTGQDAFEKLEAGASYLQLYTAFALHGPPIVTKIKTELDKILKEKNMQSVKDAVGSNYKNYLKK